jgi:hypothetical protein
MKIIENFLSDKEHQDLTKLVKSNIFDWFYMDYTSEEEFYGGANTTERPQFVHTFFYHGMNMQFIESLEPFKHALARNNIEPGKLLHIKANMLLKDENYPPNHFHPPHADVNKDNKFLSLLYYINDSDGDTFFFNKTYDTMPDFRSRVDDLKIVRRVKPKANMAVLFDSAILHASSSPIETDRRLVINAIFEL